MRHQAIERLLPAAFQRAATPGSPLRALLEVMEELHAPDEAVLAGIEELFLPYRTGDRFVPFLAGWLARDDVTSGSRLPLPVGRLRDLVAEGAALAQWRGTPAGLVRTLEIATGVTGFVIEEPAGRPFHFVVHVPPVSAEQLALVRRIVASDKPAATTAQVVAPDPQAGTDNAEGNRP